MRESEYCQLRLFRRQHSRLQRIQRERKVVLLYLSNQFQKPGLLGDIPSGVAGTVVWQHGQFPGFSPGTKRSADHRDQVLDDGRTEYFEKEVLVGQSLLPCLLSLLLDFVTGADCDQYDTSRLCLGK